MGARAWVVALCALTGCASGVRVARRGDPPRKVSALAVYPFEFGWSEPAYRSYQLGWVTALDALQGNRYALFGPGEFQLRDERQVRSYASSDLAMRAAEHGVPPEQVLVVRGWADRHEQQSIKTITDAAGRPAGEKVDAASTLVGHLEVLDPNSGEVLLSLEAEGPATAPAVPGDPDPALTALLRRLDARLLSELEDLAPGVEVQRSLPAELTWNPEELFQFELEGRACYDRMIARLDPPSREQARLAPLRFFVPEATDGRLKDLTHLPAGLVVAKLTPEARAWGLLVGDVITEVNGDPATPLALARALRAAPEGQPVPLTVRRGGGDRVPLRAVASR